MCIYFYLIIYYQFRKLFYRKENQIALLEFEYISTNELIERVPMCFGTPRRDHVSTYLLLDDIHFRDVYNLIRLSLCLLAHSSSENTTHCEGALPADSRAEFFIMRSDRVEPYDL